MLMITMLDLVQLGDLLILDKNNSDRVTTSVALATFNGERYLEDQLMSILKQSVQPDEVIICDDKSSDGTYELLESIQAYTNVTIRIIRNNKNVGLVENFQQAIDLCSGKYIFLSDQDDLWVPNKIEAVVDVFEARKNIDYVISNAKIIDHAGVVIHDDLWRFNGTSGQFEEFQKGSQSGALLSGSNMVYGNCLAFKGSLKRKFIPITSRSASITHDMWIALVLSLSGYRGLAIDFPLVHYRQHIKQVIGAGLSNSRLDLFYQKLFVYYPIDPSYIKALSSIVSKVESCADKGEIDENGLILLKRKILYFENRLVIQNSKFFKRLLMVCAELISGRYRIFGSSFFSAVKDLFNFNRKNS